MQLTENFSLSEFRCHDGSEIPSELLPNIQLLATQLQVLRDELGAPIHLNCGYRSPEHNAKVGGVTNSQHLLGKAADITTKNKTPKQLTAIIERLIKEGKMLQGGIGTYAGFVHYDIRGTKARWS